MSGFSEFSEVPAAFNAQQQSTMLANLSEHGWSQQALFLPESLRSLLADECCSLAHSGALKPAGVGRSAAFSVQTGIRGDQIRWLNPGQSQACDAYLSIMESLRQVLNQHLFLGLDEYESHFAWYSPGNFYQKHLDRFHDDDKRTVSVVIYLNQDWLSGQGGALRIHSQDAVSQDIYPVGASIVVFLSAEILHEVLPATHDRLSLAGWFRRRS